MTDTTSKTLASAEAAYIAALKTIVEAADAADAPIHTQIKALQAQLTAHKDPTILVSRHRYRQLNKAYKNPA